MSRPVAFVVTVALLDAACYNYMPMRRSSLARALGPTAFVVRGRYLSATDRGLALAVESVELRRGDILRWAGETVVVPGEFVREVEQRTISRSKVALLAGAAVAGFVVANRAFGPASDGGVSGGGGPGPSPH